MIASLPMYDLPELRPATDAWWQGLASHLRQNGISAPARLTRPDAHRMEHWMQPDLVFSQTCGWPLARPLRQRLTILATPHYAVPGCIGPHYSSVIFARKDGPPSLREARGLRFCFNSPCSQSGYHSLRRTLAPIAKGARFFGAAIQSGAHRNSLAMIRAGAADIAAVDAITYHLIRTHAPAEVAGLSVIGQTVHAPGLAYVTAAGVSPDTARRMRTAITAALADPALATARAALFITGASHLTDTDYAPLASMSDAVDRQTCQTLAQAAMEPA